MKNEALLAANAFIRELLGVLRATSLGDQYHTTLGTTLYDFDFAGPGTKLHNVDAPEDAVFAKQGSHFLRRYSLAGQPAPDSTQFFYSKHPAPTRLKLWTADRLGFLEAAQNLAKLYDGRNLALNYSFSWAHDHNYDEPGPRDTITIFELGFDLTAPNPFDAKSWLKANIDEICHSADPRADYDFFAHARRTLKDDVSGFCQETRRGLWVGLYDDGVLERLIKAAYSDCKVEMKPHPDCDTAVEIIYPDMFTDKRTPKHAR